MTNTLIPAGAPEVRQLRTFNPRFDDWQITGTDDDIARTLAVAKSTGRLVCATAPVVLADQRQQIALRLRTETAEPTTPAVVVATRPSRINRLALTMAVISGAVVLGLATTVYLLREQIIAGLKWALIALLVVGGASLVHRVTGRGHGHCPGAFHR